MHISIFPNANHSSFGRPTICIKLCPHPLFLAHQNTHYSYSRLVSCSIKGKKPQDFLIIMLQERGALFLPLMAPYFTSHSTLMQHTSNTSFSCREGRLLVDPPTSNLQSVSQSAIIIAPPSTIPSLLHKHLPPSLPPLHTGLSCFNPTSLTPSTRHIITPSHTIHHHNCIILCTIVLQSKP